MPLSGSLLWGHDFNVGGAMLCFDPAFGCFPFTLGVERNHGQFSSTIA